MHDDQPRTAGATALRADETNDVGGGDGGDAMRGRHTRWRWRDEPEACAGGVRDALSALRLPGVVEGLLRGRGVTGLEDAQRFLRPTLTQLEDPAALPGCEAAAGLVVAAVHARRPIVVYGDYDVDGVTASAILWHTLRALGGVVTTYVPHRLDEGYGLNATALEGIAAETPGALVVSVDCGINAVGPAAAATAAGLELIITDHHHLDRDALPEAAAIVHPELEGEQVTPLCGAGVALKLAWQVARQHCGAERLPSEMSALMVDCVALAALGTVADVVPLVGENRVITASGLRRIKDTRFVGLNALIDHADLRNEKVDAVHVGFVLGPRLNAVGRLGHARDAVRLLTGAEEGEAGHLAAALNTVNDERRRTERRIFDEAVEMVEAEGYATDDRRALVLAGAGWHPGVVGIVASRLVERYHRPAVMLCLVEEDGERVAKGSARSVDGVSIHAALASCADRLQRFGGHEMAAGLQCDAGEVDAVRDAVVAHVNDALPVEGLVGWTKLDLDATLADCTLESAAQVASLAPFGRGNPTPRLLIRGVTLQRPAQRIGNGGGHLRLMLKQGGAVQSAVAFGLGDDAPDLPGGAVVDVVAELKVNDFRGTRRADLHVKDWRVSEVAK